MRFLPKLETGDLNRRLIIEYGQPTFDGSDRTWVPKRTVWAHIRTLNSYEREESEILATSSASHMIRIRYVAGLDYGEWRFVHEYAPVGTGLDGVPPPTRRTVYRVDGVVDVDLEHRELLIYAHTNDVTS